MRRTVAALATTALVAATAGCSVYEDLTTSDYVKESADTIFLDAVRATTEAESVRLTGWIKSDGRRVEFSLMSGAPKTCSGTLSYFGADLDVRLTPDASYLKGSASTWREFPGLAKGLSPAAASRLAGRWIEVGNDAGFQPLCDLARDLLTTKERAAVDAGEVPGNLELKHRGLAEAAGEDTAQLDVIDKSGPSEVFVSLEEPHHIVKLVQRSRKASAEVTFSDYGFPADVAVPKDAVGLDDLFGRRA